MLQFRKSKVKDFLAVAMIFFLLMGQIVGGMPFQLARAAGDDPVLVITGTGLEQDVFLYESDLAFDNPAMEERYYSSNNSHNFRSIWRVKGFDLLALLDQFGGGNLKEGDWPIKFMASDGLSLTFTISQLQDRYYYPDLTLDSEEQVDPMIGIYRAQLYNVVNPEPPIEWEDRDLTAADRDGDAPRLYLGQTQGDTSDMNQTSFVRNLVRIVVGEERPVVFTVCGDGAAAEKTFTMAQLKAVPEQYKIDEDYEYNTKGGPAVVSVKGVSLWYVLNDLVGITDPEAQVHFICSDGYPVEPKTLAEISDPDLKYVLAYEVDGEPISDDGGNASLRIYRKQAYEGEFGTTFKAIVAVELVVEEDWIDFSDSPYKHINYDGAPYNVDSLTGATMTVEGPGLESYRALSLRQLEEENNGLYRGQYIEKVGSQVVENTYEGIKISYILDNFVNLRDNVGEIVFKNYLRQEIGRFTLEEIRDEERMMIAAYGVNEVPLVYKDLDAGYLPDKGNDGGCLKLVYHPKEGEAVPTFINVAYIYVEEDQRPGYEHATPPYNDPKFTQYIFSLSGSALGKEVNYTVADLEAMTDLHLEKEYCLSNSFYYWYFNTYKGVPLWDLLLHAGLDPNTPEDTPVHFIAADYYNIPPLTVGEIKNHDLWGYYEKNPEDPSDGTFDGSNEEPLETGYPVLVAYGFNGYPYVTRPSDPGYNSGLGNDGGPLRIIFGKRDYAHTNGSHQVQFALRVVVGDDLPYTTHSYAPYDDLAEETLTVTVKDESGAVIKTEVFTVAEIEELIYGDDVPAATADRARAKGYYYTHNAGGGDTKISDLYEGVGLSYFLFDIIGLPGTMGTVTFSSSTAEPDLVVNLEDIVRTDYFNEVTGVDWLKPVLAFAKNGYPLVKNSGDPGYQGSPIVNRYGPLMALFGQTEEGEPGRWLRSVNAITVDMSLDPYAHLNPPYDQYAGDILTISGSGVRNEHEVTVGELEFMQNYIFGGEYCLAKSADEKESAPYRGIDIYEYIRREVGFTAGADTITFKAADGLEKSFSLDEISKNDYINEITGAGNLKVILAYGKNEKPLVPDESSAGYDAAAGNDGGPLRLVVGQTEAGDLNSSKSVANVVEIIVEASSGDSWKHDYGVYTQYLDLPVLRVTGSQVAQPRTFSLRQLEALDQYIIRDIFTGQGATEVEGVILWNLIKDVVGLKAGVTIPSSIRVYAGPGYNQLQNTSQVMNGVVNSQGLTKDIILGYAVNGYPLVPHESSVGYVHNNAFGPLRLVVEENFSMWTKWVDCIVVGTGDYEEPRAEDIIEDPTGPVVFTVSSDGVPGGSKGYTLAELQEFDEVTASYSYTSGGELVTDEATGVLLADILADLGITNPAWELNVTSTDGFNPGTFTLQEALDQAYLVTYLVNGEPFEDTKEGYDSSTIRIYRHYNDGSNWRNRLTLITGVEVTSTDPPVVFTVSGDGVPGGSKGYTLAELQEFDEVNASYSYTSGGELVTDEATGVLLADILADLGITNPAWELNVTSTDGFNPGTFTLQEAIDQGYLVTYLVNGAPFEDTKEGYDSSTIRIYRHYNDGSNWRNRLTLITGVTVTSTEQPVVFTVSGDGVPGGSKGYTLAELQEFDEVTASYSYTTGGQPVTDEATGVLLADILANLGITNPAWELNVTSTDGFNPGTFTLQEALDQAYLVTYLVNGQPFEDTDEEYDSSTIRIYRHYNDGSNWRNRLTLVNGVEVSSTDLDLPWTFYRNDDGSSLPWANVYCVTPDHEGGLWVGTNGAGAAYRSPAGVWTIYNKNNSPLTHDMIISIEVDDMGGVWFVGGSPVEGLGIFHKQGGTWTRYSNEQFNQPEDFNFTMDVTLDEEGGAWFATDVGPVYRDKDGNWRFLKDEYDFPTNFTTTVTLDHKGGTWFGFRASGGTTSGYSYLDANGNLTTYPLTGTGTWVRTIAVDQDGGVWVVRLGKVDYISPSGQRTVFETGKDLIPFLSESDSIQIIQPDDQGGLWFGTSESGLYYQNRDGRFTVFNRENTWPRPQFDSIWGLRTCPSGALYVSTNGGVALLPPPPPAGSNADLQRLYPAFGTLMPAFDPSITEYRIALEDESAGVPAVGAAVADVGRATRVIRNASSFAEKTRVTVTAENGTQKTYTLGFLREIQLPAPGTVENPAKVTVEVGQIPDLYLNIPEGDASKYAVTIIAPDESVKPTLMLNTTVQGNRRTALLPGLSLQSTLTINGKAQVVQVDFPAGTKVSGPEDWDGVIRLPAIKENPGVSINGKVSIAIELGLPQGELRFDRAVRILLPGQAGKAAGFVRDGSFTVINQVLAEDNQAHADQKLLPDGHGKIDVASDLAIWTKHFTTFVAYTPASARGSKPLPSTSGAPWSACLFYAAVLGLALGRLAYHRKKMTCQDK